MCVSAITVAGKATEMWKDKKTAWQFWLAFFVAQIHWFLLHHFNETENEVWFGRKVDAKKPFKEVNETENDVRGCEVGLSLWSRVCDVMLMVQGKIL